MDSQGNKKTEVAAGLRFAVLRHEGYGDLHWDMLIELEAGAARVATWRLPGPPETWHRAIMPAIRLADHRQAYLEYEGDISDNRGRVVRVEAGTIEMLEADDRSFRWCLGGRLLRGEMQANHTDGTAWEIRFIPTP